MRHGRCDRHGRAFGQELTFFEMHLAFAAVANGKRAFRLVSLFGLIRG
jgi:hypothetical protein